MTRYGTMTLNEVIDALIEARNHYVNENSDIAVLYDDDKNTNNTKILGSISNIDYDNNGVNVYIQKDLTIY